MGWQGRSNSTKRNHPILFVKATWAQILCVFACLHAEFFVAISPVRQRAAKNLFRSYLFNGYRRLSSQVPYWIVPVLIGTFSRAHTSRNGIHPALQVTQRTRGPRNTMLTSTARRDTSPTLESTKLHLISLPIDPLFPIYSQSPLILL